MKSIIDTVSNMVANYGITWTDTIIISIVIGFVVGGIAYCLIHADKARTKNK